MEMLSWHEYIRPLSGVGLGCHYTSGLANKLCH